MRTSSEIIKSQQFIINEVEIMLRMQQKYFDYREATDLDKLRIQQSKVKKMIAENKHPIPTLR